MAAKKTLLLAGGGHSHLLALESLRNLPAGWRGVLVSDNRYAAYSGMAPGVVAGHYKRAECFIDVRRAAQRAGFDFIDGSVGAIDLRRRRLALACGREIDWDLLSLNTGVAARDPGREWKSDDPAAVVAAKPVGALFDWIEKQNFDRRQVAVVGAGAAGIELALALSRRAQTRGESTQVSIVDGAAEILPSFGNRFRALIARELAARGIDFVANFAVVGFAQGRLIAADGRRVAADCVVAAGFARAPDYVARAGIETDAAGFARVDRGLRCVGRDDIFACGDIAAHVPPLPKSGVFAVRQGLFLGRALTAAMRGETPPAWRNPSRFLTIVAAGNARAFFARGAFCGGGAWVWRWKQFLDLRFARRFPRQCDDAA